MGLIWHMDSALADHQQNTALGGDLSGLRARFAHVDSCRAADQSPMKDVVQEYIS